MKLTQGFWVGAALVMSALSLFGRGEAPAARAQPQVDAVPRTAQVSACREVTGPCGEGMLNRQVHYIDRLKFSCPTEAPILSGFRYLRCGPRNDVTEGLQVIGKCCALE